MWLMTSRYRGLIITRAEIFLACLTLRLPSSSWRPSALLVCWSSLVIVPFTTITVNEDQHSKSATETVGSDAVLVTTRTLSSYVDVAYSLTDCALALLVAWHD